MSGVDRAGGTVAPEMPQLRILGPVEVVVDGRPVPLRSRRQRGVLAVLLANANRTTVIDQLLAALWADDIPDTAVGQLHTLVWRLRHVLGPMIVTRPGGYQINLGPGELDADDFARLTAEAGELAAVGQLAAAAERYAGALALWRGVPFADVELPGDGNASGLFAAAVELAEQRLAAVRDHLDVELALGRHAELVPRLRALVGAEPLREELRERLMIALHRSGRRAEALECYRDGRAALIRELGLEPGDNLRRLHDRILSSADGEDVGPADPDGGDAPPDPPVPPASAQLPADLVDFVGREELTGELAGALTAGPAPGAAPVVTISGAAGSGKTALAVRVAHRVRADFPDGQLFVDLRGGSDPLDPDEVLARFLRALGEDPRRVPVEPDERAALFRARTEGRRILLVLDNAEAEPQVRPLLPAEPRCAVLVTSRPRLAALAGTHQVDLGVFTPGQAVELLRRTLGADRVDAEPAESARIVDRCGRLPLAIRIAGARLAARPHWTVSRLADQLADSRARLDVLRTGDLEVRSSLAVSYGALGGSEQAAFRMLGVPELPEIPGWALTPLLAVPLPEAEELVERLVEVRLLDAYRPVAGSSEVRYRMHDLVHAFARELLAATTTDRVRAAARARFCGAWLALAETATARLPAGFRRGGVGTAERWAGWTPADLDAVIGDDPLAWCERERATLVAVVRQAATAGLDELAWDLAATLARFFELREHLEDWRGTHESALAACRAAGNRRGAAYLLRGLGELHLDSDRLTEALDCLRPALAGLVELGDRFGQSLVLRALGTTYRLAGRPDEALDASTRALAICVELDDPTGRAQILHNLGVLHRRAGRLAEAERTYRAALLLFRQLGDRFGEAYTLCSLGIVVAARSVDPVRADAVSEAEAQFSRSVAICAEVGYRRGEAIAVGHLGELHLRAGRYDLALVELRRAVAGCQEVGDRPGVAIGLRRLGELFLARGDRSAGRAALRRCLALSRQCDLPEERARAMELLGTLRAPIESPLRPA
ncbi:AfsR/SARP family transcriptional regulator [Micromonospora echinofusca]|uniref:Tetratricopeptide repeat protein n=1 Tax=Micromonospora echinofusca TaxID=47858 RepID=A0ABS3VK48_MICEH|nr:AfsR/SARP family transcriptional regulator [Micromonospora echinofusca]MBO4204895.1 tetratricopeptide repeat protein [Micromonospora echinofusca]